MKKILLTILGIFSFVALSAQVKIGENIEEISPFALLELESTDAGLILPRMTTAQRDAAFNQDTPVGTVIYNMDQNQVQYLHFEITAAGKITNHKVWEGATDEVVFIGSDFPTDPNNGDLYYDEAGEILYVWNDSGQEWLPINQTRLASSMIEYPDGQGGTTTVDLSDLIGLPLLTASNTLVFTTMGGDQVTVDLGTTAAPQTLAISGTNLSISGGNTVDLSSLVSATTGPAGAPGPPGPQGLTGPQGPPGTAAATGTLAVENLTVSNTLSVLGTTTLDGPLVDASGNVGTPGQILSSTGSSTEWINNSSPMPGTVTNATLRWSGTAWVQATTLLSSPTEVNVSVSSTLATTTLQAGLQDADGDLGTPGQVLSTTGSSTNWITLSSGIVTQTSSNYTVDLSEDTVYVSPTTAVTITLPTPTPANNGDTLTIKRINAYNGTGDTLEIVSAAQIEGTSAALRLNISYQGYTLQAFNNQWFITQRF